MIIRASALGEIMAPAKKAGELSAGAKTFIKKAFKEELFGFRDTPTSKYMEKGTLVEQDAIDLYNEVHFTDYAKNTERRQHEGILTGECDIFTGDSVIDIKSSWSLATFPIWPDEAANTGYEWQLRAYMLLWDCPRAELAYCMVTTPEHLRKWENPDMHIVDHIPEHMRITKLPFERDAALETQMLERIRLALAYFDQLKEEYGL